MTGKKLVVLCDGTWKNSDFGWEKEGLFSEGRPQHPTNVTRISRAILPIDEKTGQPQIIYYQAGLGSGWSVTDHLLSGGLALGISGNIREAYSFLVNNYTELGSSIDEIYLLGFSRGAFTARSVGGVIGSLGLLSRDAMMHFYQIFEDYENAGKDGYEPKLPEFAEEFKLTASPKDIKTYLSAYKAELQRLKWTRNVKITAIGVWDTVGALGLPINPWLQKLGLPTSITAYRFFDTGIGEHCLNAFQALALDERRAAFQATVWEKDPENKTTNLQQCWFSGVHSDIGGGYEDTSQANLSLAWMMSKLSPYLAFDEKYLEKQVTANRDKFYSKGWTWGMTKINDSMKLPTSLAGSDDRDPGCNEKLEYPSGRRTGTFLQNTHETIHPSARARFMLGGKDAHDRLYKPNSLHDWTPIVAGNGGPAKWQYTGSKKGVKELEEAELGDYEKMILAMDDDMNKLIMP